MSVCYPVIDTDDMVQIGDKVRIDLSKTFVARPDNISVVKTIEVKPTNDAAFITIHNKTIPAQTYPQKDWYLDWIYLNKLISGVPADNHTISVRITLDDNSVHTANKFIKILTESEDKLFSRDSDLVVHEFDIMKWLPDGRSSWKYMHRRAQSRILSYLNEKGFNNKNGEPFTKDNIFNVEDFKEWSVFMTLYLIFSTVLNSRGDVFTKKAMDYENKETRANKRVFRVDSDGDGDSDSVVDTNGPMLVRR